MKKRGRRASYWVLTGLITAIGIGILFYPAASELWNRWRDARLMTQYEQSAQTVPTDTYEEIWQAAREYNQHHTVNVMVDVFDEEDAYVLTHPYDTMLDPNGSGLMGIVEIPKIGQRLPIHHGIGAESLEQGVGHVEGTSLPIGGPSTHAVLAAHRGLPSKKLFTDLDQLELGDQFYLYVMDEVLAYQVDRITTVLPTEADELAIEAGCDYVTLLTCTPYGVNTHRLLVRGVRVPYSQEVREEQAAQMDVVDSIRDLPLKLLGVGLIAVIILVPLIRLTIDRRDNRKRQRQSTGRNRQENAK